jgi:pimeloyl-ACP methyl ester carboxylesterase
MSTAGDGWSPGGAGAGEKGVRTVGAGAGHAFMAQQPERVAQLIVEFLAA